MSIDWDLANRLAAMMIVATASAMAVGFHSFARLEPRLGLFQPAELGARRGYLLAYGLVLATFGLLLLGQAVVAWVLFGLGWSFVEYGLAASRRR